MAKGMTKLKGYCFDKEGRYGSSVTINSEPEFSQFLVEHIAKHHELRVVDENDDIVFHAIDQVLIYPIPSNGSPNNKWNDEKKMFQTTTPPTMH